MYASNLRTLGSRPYSSSFCLRNWTASSSSGLPEWRGERVIRWPQFSLISSFEMPDSRSDTRLFVSSVSQIMNIGLFGSR